MLPLIGKPDAMASRILRVVVKPFMDSHCYDQRRIEQCCTKIIDERGIAASFCEYNVLHRSPRIPKRGIALPMLATANRSGGSEIEVKA